MNEQEQPRRRRRRLYRTSADWFGLATVALLMICSLVLLVQLMSTKMLTDLYLIVIEVVLLLINAGHVLIQLPIRRVKTGKVLCGLLALVLSGLMLYGSVAAASGRSALLAIAGKNLQKTTSYVVVMADDPARSIGDTVGYTFGIGVANVVSLLGVDTVSIGGGLANLGECLRQPVEKYAEQYVFISGKDRFKVVICSLLDNNVPVGAALYARDGFRTV